VHKGFIHEKNVGYLSQTIMNKKQQKMTLITCKHAND